MKPDAVKKALAKKFDYPIEDFSLVTYEVAGKKVAAVVLTATEGHNLGDPNKTYDAKRSWDKLMAKDKDPRFIIEVDGKKIDTREPIDGELLKAVAAANPAINEWVWRTGEEDKADRDVAPVASLRGGQVYQYWNVRSDDLWYIRFRPAVVIRPLELDASSDFSSTDPTQHTKITDEILDIIDTGDSNRYAVALRLTRWYEAKIEEVYDQGYDTRTLEADHEIEEIVREACINELERLLVEYPIASTNKHAGMLRERIAELKGKL